MESSFPLCHIALRKEINRSFNIALLYGSCPLKKSVVATFQLSITSRIDLLVLDEVHRIFMDGVILTFSGTIHWNHCQ
jgi:hypothetical protein